MQGAQHTVISVSLLDSKEFPVLTCIPRMPCNSACAHARGRTGCPAAAEVKCPGHESQEPCPDGVPIIVQIWPGVTARSLGKVSEERIRISIVA